MDLYVNGNKLDIILEDEKTIGDVLKNFEAECEKTQSTTVSIKINDTVVSADTFDQISQEEIKEDTKIELGVVSADAIEASFIEEKKFCIALSQEIKELSVKFQSGKDKEANLLITKLADLVDNVCHTASLSTLFPDRFSKISIEGKSFQEFFSEFSEIFKDFEGAIESHDTVLMGDLAEYEISPRLEQLANALEL